jgi:multidrug efflux pump subunit AcrB
MVLLAVVIALGMLVDDAVVVAEAIYHRIQRGEPRDQAVFSALREVAAPVTTAVLTTMAAFLPLVLLPGILGEFMRVIPMVVTIALAISLVEAYWMLPAHVMTMQFKPQGQSSGRFQQLRERMTRRIRIGYTRLLIKVLRFPYRMLLFSLLLFALAIGAMFSPMVKYDFFASDTLRLFYINVEMQPTSVLRDTHAKVAEVEALARRMLETDEYREMVGYAGLMFTETEPRLGNQYGQVLIGLNPRLEGMRTVEQIFDDLRASIDAVPGVANISFLKLSGGPPAAKPISVKVRGDNYAEILSAASALKQAMADNPLISDISDDADRGALQVSFRLRHDRVRELGLDPIMLARTIRIAADGEIVSAHQIRGEKTELRVRSARQRMDSIEQLGAQVVFNATGQALPLSELIEARHATALGNIRHYNFKRTITVEADIDKTQIDAVAANNFVREQWEKVKADYPNISLDFSGILDDIYQALDSMLLLGIFGVGLMYMILGTQFKSYFQPMMILVAVPLAFIGVVLGILITRQPVSLYTLYGIVALAGIAVNSAIVLISSANMRLEGGMSLLHSTVYAARRRVIPIIITSLTTIGGLFSLATGLGGESLIWGPVANAIVWGLGFSATLTLFVIPVLYRAFMARSHLSQARSAVVSANPAESG